MQSGLLERPDFSPRIFGWDFPLVTQEQIEQFGLRGYVCCYTVPSDFEPACPGAQLAWIDADEYAVLRLKNPLEQAEKTVPAGWERLHRFIEEGSLRPRSLKERYCFEEIVHEEGQVYMDLYHPIR